MPEGPELHLAARFVNQVGSRHQFGGAVVKSEVSNKNPDVPWSADRFSVKAEARGKEMKVLLEGGGKKMSVLFRFGMSGSFQLCAADDLPKHAHLRFFTVGDNPGMVLCFVDYRRFGRWFVDEDWSEDRGPDPMFEYEAFRENVLKNLKNSAFNKPICEAMLNQKFFNGIGNYLRAEILYRARIKPFDQAREVLEGLGDGSRNGSGPDLLQLCSTVPREVVALNNGMGFDAKFFNGWIQCYTVRGMNALADSNKRTIWFSGPPGSMVPKNAKTRGKESSKNTKKLKTKVEEVEVEDDKPDLFADFVEERTGQVSVNGISDAEMVMLALGLSNINFQQSLNAAQANPYKMYQSLLDLKSSKVPIKQASEVITIDDSLSIGGREKRKQGSAGSDAILISSDSENEDTETEKPPSKNVDNDVSDAKKETSERNDLLLKMDIGNAISDIKTGADAETMDAKVAVIPVADIGVKRKAGKCGKGCHLCGNPIPRPDKKKKCYCNKMVHADCYTAQGTSCASHKIQ